MPSEQGVFITTYFLSNQTTAQSALLDWLLGGLIDSWASEAGSIKQTCSCSETTHFMFLFSAAGHQLDWTHQHAGHPWDQVSNVSHCVSPFEFICSMQQIQSG